MDLSFFLRALSASAVNVLLFLRFFSGFSPFFLCALCVNLFTCSECTAASAHHWTPHPLPAKI
jgi:primosomal protein N'